MPLSFDGCLEKLARADEHLETFRRETYDKFLKGEPYRVVGKLEGNEYVCRIKILRDLPLLPAVIVGDFLFNLRSALDHLVYALSGSPNQSPPKGTEFPIFKDRGKFANTGRGGGLYKIRGVEANERAVIEALQPYHSADYLSHPLWVLQELSNADKHRTLHLAWTVIEDMSFNFKSNDLVISSEELIPGPFVDGAPIARAFIIQTGPKPVMEVDYSLTFNVTFDERTLFQGVRGPLPNLIELRDEVAAIVAKLT